MAPMHAITPHNSVTNNWYQSSSIAAPDVFLCVFYQCSNQSALLNPDKGSGIDPPVCIPDDVLIGWGDLSSL